MYVKQEDTEYLVSQGLTRMVSLDDLSKVRYCRTSAPNGLCRYCQLGCKPYPEYTVKF